MKAIIHTYLSKTLFYVLDYHLQLKNNFIDEFILVFCRWNTFPDKGYDININLLQEKFEKEFESVRIKIINHYGIEDHNEFECREEIMNAYSDYDRIWIDSDELLGGRFWYLHNVEAKTCYKLRHLIVSGEGINEFVGIPYMFAKNVRIKYANNDFLSLEAFYNNQKLEPVYIPKLFNFSLGFAENPLYKEAKKEWKTSW